MLGGAPGTLGRSILILGIAVSLKQTRIKGKVGCSLREMDGGSSKDRRESKTEFEERSLTLQREAGRLFKVESNLFDLILHTLEFKITQTRFISEDYPLLWR